MKLAQPIFTQINRETAMKHPLQTARKLATAFILVFATVGSLVAPYPAGAAESEQSGKPTKDTKTGDKGGKTSPTCTGNNKTWPAGSTVTLSGQDYTCSGGKWVSILKQQ
jgi:hypothetical protein